MGSGSVEWVDGTSIFSIIRQGLVSIDARPNATGDDTMLIFPVRVLYSCDDNHDMGTFHSFLLVKAYFRYSDKGV